MKVAQGFHPVQKRRFDEGKDYFWTVKPWATFMKKLFIHSARECSSINNIEEIYISTLQRSSPQTLRVCILEKWLTRLLCPKINFSGQSVQSYKNLRFEKPLKSKVTRISLLLCWHYRCRHLSWSRIPMFIHIAILMAALNFFCVIYSDSSVSTPVPGELLC